MCWQRLLLARLDTAHQIVRRLDERPKCMRMFSDEDGAHRLYNANGDVRARPDELMVYRRGDGQNVWLYYEDTSEVELRANGETIATFDSPADVFEDADAYPATEKDISDFSEYSKIKRPAFPPERGMVDVIAVTDDGLRVLEDGEETPIDELVGGRRRSNSPARRPTSNPSPGGPLRPLYSLVFAQSVSFGLIVLSRVLVLLDIERVEVDHDALVIDEQLEDVSVDLSADRFRDCEPTTIYYRCRELMHSRGFNLDRGGINGPDGDSVNSRVPVGPVTIVARIEVYPGPFIVDKARIPGAVELGADRAGDRDLPARVDATDCSAVRAEIGPEYIECIHVRARVRPGLYWSFPALSWTRNKHNTAPENGSGGRRLLPSESSTLSLPLLYYTIVALSK